ncbi:MAG: hypothetical protein PUA56_01170 [Bacillales bacterium]|nr:hypothetical protein [Bacillales bacterium]
MQELDELKKEDELNKKFRQKRRIRGVLITINALLLAYVGFLTVQSIYDAVKLHNVVDSKTVITVLGKNEKNSLLLYDKYITKNEESKNNNLEVADIATYGRYLLTSECHISYDSLHVSKADSLVRPIKLVENPSLMFSNKDAINYGEKIDEQIDLYSFDEGEYILFNDFDYSTPEKRKVYHYTNNKYFSEVLYSVKAKDSQEQRKEITIKAVSSSPALVISVRKISVLPSNTYDFVVLNENGLNSVWLSSLKAKYSVFETTSLVEAYKANASYAINLVDGSSITTSNYVTKGDNHSSLIEGGAYNGLDKDNFIRELGGYVFNAGYGVSGNDEVSKASLLIKNNYKDSHIGKFAINVGIDASFDNIMSVFGF